MSSYKELVNVEEFWDKKEVFSMERWEVSFYCKDCEVIVETERPDPKWYTFKCKKCWNWNIAIWTENWLKENYHIK